MQNSPGDVVTSEWKNEPVKDLSDTVEAIPNNLSYYNSHESQMRSGSQFPQVLISLWYQGIMKVVKFPALILELTNITMHMLLFLLKSSFQLVHVF